MNELKNITVIKRDGREVRFDMSKIISKVDEAFRGIKETDFVNKIDFLKNLRQYLKDKQKTSEIQQIAILVAKEKIDLGQEEYNTIAVRLFMQDLEHRIYKIHKLRTYSRYAYINDSEKDRLSYSSYLGEIYYEYLIKGIEFGVLNPILINKYTKDELIFAGSFINPEWDDAFSYTGLKVFYDRYLKKDHNGDVFELPQWRFLTLSLFLAQDETNITQQDSWYSDQILKFRKEHNVDDTISDRTILAIKYYQTIAKFDKTNNIYFKYVPSTPTLDNSGTLKHQLASCFQGETSDIYECIADQNKEYGILSKYGGGIGDYAVLRASGDPIRGHVNASKGPIPFFKIRNDIMVATDQLGTRKGALAQYIPIWHPDIKAHIDLKRKGGDERQRAHDLFPGVVIPDLFMKVVYENYKINDQNKIFYLISPYYDKEGKLDTLYGEEWEEYYLSLVDDDSVKKVPINAVDLWLHLLNTYYKDGSPFLIWRDNMNKSHMLRDVGTIKASNLCTEMAQFTKAPDYHVCIEFENTQLNTKVKIDEKYVDVVDGKLTIKESDVVLTTQGLIRGNRLSRLNSIIDNEGNQHKIDLITLKQDENSGHTLVCNLGSINLRQPKEQLEESVMFAMRMLDSVIDLNMYPTKRVKRSAMNTRAVGLGVMNVYNYVVNELDVEYGSKESLNSLAKQMAYFHYYSIKASIELAKEKGSFPLYEQSEWKKNKLPIEYKKEYLKKIVDSSTFNEIMDLFDSLKKDLKKYGIRNGYINAIAPTGSISLIGNQTSGIEPIYQKKWFEENVSGLLPVIAPGLTAKSYQKYKSAYEIHPYKLTRCVALIQCFIDQAISYNIFYDKSKKELYGDKILTNISQNIYLGWKMGIKSNYYLRSQSPKQEDTDKGDVLDRSMECQGGCQ